MNPSKKTLIIIYLVFLVILFWHDASKRNAPVPPPVRLIANGGGFTLPVTPIISLVNETENPISVDTCRDVEVVANGLQKTSLPPSFCRTLEVASKSVTPLFGDTKEDILTYQERFADVQKVSLRFSYHIPETEDVSEVSLEIRHAGWIRLFFRTLFYDPVYNLFAALILIVPGHSLGWAIVAITLIIRLILLIPQQRMMVSQRRLQAIQPKLKAIQEEHKGDQATIGMKMMELYKKEGVNPLGSCLPILIQLPILIVLYQVILNIANPTNLSHLYGISWLQSFQNLTIPTNFFGIFLDKSGGWIGIVLGIVTGGLQFWQMWLAQRRITNKKKDIQDAKTADKKKEVEGMPDMQQMQKMMIYIFPVMAAIFAFQFPAGVALYWLIGTIFMIVQQAIANRQAEDKKMIIRDAAGSVIG